MMFIMFVFFIILLLLYYLYKFIINPYKFWKNYGIPYAKPTLFFGNITEFVTGQKNICFVLDEIYKSFPNDPYVGFYNLRSPSLLIKDPELVKRILVRDFSYFYDRSSLGVDENLNPLLAHLVNLKGSRWKTTRNKLTPAFSSGKLKQMYFLIEECGRELHNHLEMYFKNGTTTTIDVTEIMMKFSTDVIGRCALGLECNTLKDQNSEFRRIGRKMFTLTFSMMVKICLKFINPNLLKWIRIKDVSPDVERFFFTLFHDAINYRKLKIDRKVDFLQLMIDIKKREEQSNVIDDNAFSDTLLVANMFAFFGGGFETTASTLSFCLYELALNPKIQIKLRNEIKIAYERNGFNYDSINNLEYLDMVISETLRKYTPIPLLSRVCTHDYVIPNTPIVLKTGTKMILPIYSYHYDDKHFPNAEKFQPERFKNGDKALPMYLPFGDGPRICIGLRLAKIEIKCCLATTLLKYSFSPCDQTAVPLKMKTRSVFLAPMSGIMLNITKI